MDRLEAMRLFVEIADRGSITRAAESFEISLSTAVRTLAALESHLGVRLIARTIRSMALTEEGRAYRERCCRILSDVADAEASLSATELEPRGLLTLGAPVLFGRLHLAPIAADFIVRHPQIRVELLFVDRVVNLIDEGIDATIRIGALSDSSLIARRVGTVRRVVVASPKYLRNHTAPKKPSELAGHACIRVTGLDPTPEWHFGSERVRIDGPLSTNLIDPALDACIRGLGIGRFLSYQAQRAVKEKRLAVLLKHHE